MRICFAHAMTWALVMILPPSITKPVPDERRIGCQRHGESYTGTCDETRICTTARSGAAAATAGGGFSSKVPSARAVASAQSAINNTHAKRPAARREARPVIDKKRIVHHSMQARADRNAAKDKNRRHDIFHGVWRHDAASDGESRLAAPGQLRLAVPLTPGATSPRPPMSAAAASSVSSAFAASPAHARPAAGVLICVDIGNTHTHLAFHRDGVLSDQRDIPTPLIDDPAKGLPAVLAAFASTSASSANPGSALPAPSSPLQLAFCSVVPAATPKLLAAAAAAGVPAWQLTHEVRLGVPITYPKPAEIGQDRLANAAGAHALAPGRPAIVIDLGTAVTFDLVTPEGGYEGGIITPGPALVTRYLHERTAQLPLVTDLSTPITSVIGKSTAEAIRIGAIVGYAGLIQALLDAVLAEYAARRLPSAEIFLSGGAAQVVEGRLRLPARIVPDLALVGLAAAHALNR
jgi:type III pantothenate kinase